MKTSFNIDDVFESIGCDVIDDDLLFLNNQSIKLKITLNKNDFAFICYEVPDVCGNYMAMHSFKDKFLFSELPNPIYTKIEQENDKIVFILNEATTYFDRAYRVKPNSMLKFDSEEDFIQFVNESMNRYNGKYDPIPICFLERERAYKKTILRDIRVSFRDNKFVYENEYGKLRKRLGLMCE